MSLVDTLAPVILAVIFGGCLCTCVVIGGYNALVSIRNRSLLGKYHILVQRNTEVQKLLDDLLVEIDAGQDLSKEVKDQIWTLHERQLNS